MSTNRRFGICLPYQSQESNAPEFSDYGTVVEITRCEAFTSGDLEESEEGPLPRYIIETLGKYRFKVESRGIETAGYYFANVTRIDDLDMDDQDSVSYVGQEEKNVQICMFDTIEKEPTIHSLVRSVQAISKGLKAGKSIPAKSPWSPLTLNILIAKLRQFVADLFAGIHPHARIALESQFGSPPEDISDLTYWITQIIPLESSMKYKLLEINILKDRLKIIFTWIENATSWSNVEKDDIQSV